MTYVFGGTLNPTLPITTYNPVINRIIDFSMLHPVLMHMILALLSEVRYFKHVEQKVNMEITLFVNQTFLFGTCQVLVIVIYLRWFEFACFSLRNGNKNIHSS